MPRSTYCLVSPGIRTTTAAYETAVAVIRAEHPDLLRLSCIHEEMAQGMGLSNDSPEARPSIFNDDEEFALLTPMTNTSCASSTTPPAPGMKAEEAMPLVRQIAGNFGEARCERRGGRRDPPPSSRRCPSR
jgi:hypothetical protein